MNNPFIITERLYLRPLTFKDDYVRWLNDEEVCRNNSHRVFPHTPEEGVDYIADSMGSSENLVLAVVLKVGDVHLGNISLLRIDFKNQNAELAILMGEKEYWYQGYGHEASIALLKHGFDEMNLQRVYSNTFAENIAMRKLAGALGMRQEGVRRNAYYKNGKFVDVIEFGVLKSEFIGGQNVNG
jgi:[ribosomal protein S5]-alanine N-acetyltransferase